MKMRPTADLVRIVTAGGGLDFDAGMRLLDDLVRIATAAKSAGVQCRFRNLAMRPTDDLIRIATAGRGHVTFEG